MDLDGLWRISALVVFITRAVLSSLSEGLDHVIQPELGFIFKIMRNKTPEIWVKLKTRTSKKQWDG
jgi:hypothetical protein